MLENIHSFKEDKKVCIIVPVYNAEKYLGYCLNSILSQTYINWIAILVDDGSADSSLDICRQYESVDPRFRVIEKPNGGVSSARNTGLELAEGDYLEFVDSDDYLAPDALEKQVRLAVENNSQLIVMDTVIVDFNDPKSERVSLSSKWLEQSPCVLSAEEFKEKRMRLIRNTSLLEGPCAKLYDLELWNRLGLRFPEDISLGEDFVTNMKYYAACNGAVFLHEYGYYYNKYDGSGSLTEKYRPDLFENKMFLCEELDKHLGGRINLSEPELDAFYCYSAASGLLSVENTVLAGGMSDDELCDRVRKMFAHPLFSESLRHASYVDPRFVVCVELAQKNKIEEIVQYIANGASEEENEPHSGFLNRIIRKAMRMIIPFLGHGALRERVTYLEQAFAQNGMKVTVENYQYSHQKVNRKILDSQTRYLENKMRQQTDTLQRETDMFQRETDMLQRKMDMLQRKMDMLQRKMDMLQRNVNEYTWISEQRMTASAYRREVTDLRQRRKAILVASAEHSNIGDAAITLAEQDFLLKYYPEYDQVEISTYEFSQKEAFLHAILNAEDILFISGGGNIGDMYPAEEELHRKIVAEFPNNRIIILPQTISFSETATGAVELAKSARIYNHHKHLRLYVRGNSSLEVARTHFPDVESRLMPDMVHMLKADYAFSRKGALLCLREDQEGILDGGQKAELEQALLDAVGTVDRRTNMHTQDIPREDRGLVVRQELMRFASHKIAVTDRLHGMIFSAITGTPCVVLPSCNHKIREYYEAFFRDAEGIFLADSPEDIRPVIQKALAIEHAHCPILDQEPHGTMRRE